jgi:hypothetical protein
MKILKLLKSIFVAFKIINILTSIENISCKHRHSKYKL